MRKPNPRSRLKTPEQPERMREIYLYMTGDAKADPPAPAHTLEETEAWLAAHGTDTNIASLSEFCSWYPLWLKMHSASSTVENMKTLLRETPGLDLDEHQLSKAGQAIFEAEALSKGDSKLFLALRSLRQTDRSLDLQEITGKTKAQQKERSLEQKDKEIKLAIEKFQFDGAKAALAHLAELRSIAQDRTLSDDQKIEQVRLRLWGAPPKEMEGK